MGMAVMMFALRMFMVGQASLSVKPMNDNIY
jgi:hypothetical protein